MRGLWREVNEFFNATSIHGFPYISDNQSRSTRIIWIIIVLAGFGVTSNFLYNTVDGFNEKFVTTTEETRTVKNYPFPAITFYPGEYNSKHVFLRHFLNQFEFTRFDKNSAMRNNEKFMKLYKWLISPMNDPLMDDVEDILIISLMGINMEPHIEEFSESELYEKNLRTGTRYIVSSLLHQKTRN